MLIAMPGLDDPNFSSSVTYMCEHNEEGALGIVINRPSDLILGDILEQLNIMPATAEIADTVIMVGGPVEQNRGFVLHTPEGEWQHSKKINDAVALTTSRDILEAIARGHGPTNSLVALGYAGWGAGQLEREMLENSWLSTPADPRILYQTPVPQRWNEAAALMGIDLTLLTDYSGHA